MWEKWITSLVAVYTTSEDKHDYLCGYHPFDIVIFSGLFTVFPLC